MVKTIRKPVYHSNTTAAETDVVDVISSNEEPKKVLALEILEETNEGIIRMYRENEELQEIPTGHTTISNRLVYDVNLELPVGQAFSITLQNRVAGTNASLYANLLYEIV